MSPPKSVQAQIDAANSLHAELYSTPESDQQEGQFADEGQAESDSMESEAAPEQTSTQEPDKDSLYWQQRFNVLQGKYNNEVPALQQENRILKDQIESLNQQLANSSAQSGKAAELADKLDAGLSEDELDLVGPELVGVLKKLIATSAGSQSTVDPNEFTELKTKVDGYEREKQEHTEASFWTEVNSRFPKWKELQSSREALAYLSGIDQSTGRIRNDVIQAAAGRFDAATVIRMFQEIEALTADKREIPANKQQPDTTRNSNPDSGEQKRYWSGAEINQFYKDKTQGRYLDEQAQALEQDIFAAQSEGRIR
ncbi:hypothetical protein [Marinomonas atlantica]|uniref:hypothetical protein n=1 Tax=Marinomonas atlantica TaxID=1806668 RepID=UPI0008357D02|nr:hypothetical protein [Marinomonas atlantica]